MERFAIKIDKSLRANLYKICRLCGIDNPDKVKVLDDETIVTLDDGEPELWKKVLDCIGLLITKDDKMPQFMCTLCVDKINDFFEFREMCYATDGQTRKLLGIKEEPKLRSPTKIVAPVACKTEDKDVKKPIAVVSTQRSGRKRRNADMEICNATARIKTDEIDDIKPPPVSTNVSGIKKKRLKFDPDEDVKLIDIKSGSVSKAASGSKLGSTSKGSPPSKLGPASKLKLGPASKLKLGPASKLGAAAKLAPASKLGLSKRRLKIEPTAKEKKDTPPPKASKIMKRKLKVEEPIEIKEEEPPKPLSQLQKKKKMLELIKQRKLAKKVAVVKVEKLRKGSVDTKIKEESPVPATPIQPKVKLKDKCAICGESFVNKSLLDKHIKITHIPSVVRYHCVHCNETLKKNMEIKNHNLWHKLSKTPFQCGNCSESSCSIYTYSKHIRDCSQVAYLDAHIPDWHCPECSGVYETTYLFNIHSCVSNTLVCPGCDRSHKWREDYFKHIPTCSAAVHRIPSYMTPTIQVKNEAEPPNSPVLQQQHTQSLALPASTGLQPTPPSRITPPLMDSNQCVVIPGNMGLLEKAQSPSSKSGSKKSNRITKKDLKRFDKLLKSTMTTLVSIKQEPNQGEPTGDEEQSNSSDVREASASPPGSPAFADDDFHQHDDDNDGDIDSASDQTTSQPVGTIKQEIIDEGYRDLYNNIEVNIKREVVLNENRNTELKTPNEKEDQGADEPIAPKPVLKLKITKEHGTLNSVLLDSPKSEKKKKKKKRKEEKLKAAEREKLNATVDATEDPCNASNVKTLPDVANVEESVEQEPTMPLPEIVRIKKEITQPDEEQQEESGVDKDVSCEFSHSTSIPSIVAATSGSLQISCVSQGVHFNGGDENEDGTEKQVTDETTDETTETLESVNNIVVACDDPPEEIDIKPRLEDLIPMLRIASVSSGEDVNKKTTKLPPPIKKKRTQIKVPEKPSTSLPQIVSVSSGISTADFHQKLEKNSEVDEEKSSDKMETNNDNAFDFSQVKIKEEFVDPSYEEQDCEVAQDVDQEEKSEEETETTISDKQADENAYIANIDFNNLSIKQEKEYIDDGLHQNEDDDSSDTDSDSSSESEDSDTDTESEREYRDLPSEDEENNINVTTAVSTVPLGLQISAVHSEFTGLQPISKTESEPLVQPNTGVHIKANPDTECTDATITPKGMAEIPPDGDFESSPSGEKEEQRSLSDEPMHLDDSSRNECASSKSDDQAFTKELIDKNSDMETPDVKSFNQFPSDALSNKAAGSDNLMIEVKVNENKNSEALQVACKPSHESSPSPVIATCSNDQLDAQKLNEDENSIVFDKPLLVSSPLASTVDDQLVENKLSENENINRESIHPSPDLPLLPAIIDNPGNLAMVTQEINEKPYDDALRTLGKSSPDSSHPEICIKQATGTNDQSIAQESREGEKKSDALQTLSEPFAGSSTIDATSDEASDCKNQPVAEPSDEATDSKHQLVAQEVNIVANTAESQTLSSSCLDLTLTTLNVDTEPPESINQSIPAEIKSLNIGDLASKGQTEANESITSELHEKDDDHANEILAKVNDCPTSVVYVKENDPDTELLAKVNDSELRIKEDTELQCSSEREQSSSSISQKIDYSCKMLSNVVDIVHDPVDQVQSPMPHSSPASAETVESVFDHSELNTEKNSSGEMEKNLVNSKLELGEVLSALDETNPSLLPVCTLETICKSESDSIHKLTDAIGVPTPDMETGCSVSAVPTSRLSQETDVVEDDKMEICDADTNLDVENQSKEPKDTDSNLDVANQPEDQAISIVTQNEFAVPAAMSEISMHFPDLPSSTVTQHDEDVVMSNSDSNTNETECLIVHYLNPPSAQFSNELAHNETMTGNLENYSENITTTLDQEVSAATSTEQHNRIVGNDSLRDIDPITMQQSYDQSEEESTYTFAPSVQNLTSSCSGYSNDDHKPMESEEMTTLTQFGATKETLSNVEPMQHSQSPQYTTVFAQQHNVECYPSTVPPIEPHFSSPMPIISTPIHARLNPVQNLNEAHVQPGLTDIFSTTALQVPTTSHQSERNNNENQNFEPTTSSSIYTSHRQLLIQESNNANVNVNFSEFYKGTGPPLSNLTEFHVDLNTPTAGQLQVFATPAEVHQPLMSDLATLSSTSITSNIDLSVPVLSEDVQNILNESTVSVNNFALNDSILNVQCSTSTNAFPAPVAARNFTDLENVNEIAENNNNANIERELQDELGNVLAAAIADRSPNDEADENNVMNENRANYDMM